MRNDFDVAVKCIDASLRSAREMADNGGNSFSSEIDALLQEFRQKYEITESDFGNSEAWDREGSKIIDDEKDLDYKIMLLVWDHIYSLMIDCGAGEVAAEVWLKEVHGKTPSWEKSK